MDTIEEYQHAGCTVTIYPDPCPESPREWDNLGTFLFWHTRYALGDRNACGREQANAMLRDVPARSVVVRVFMLDHSGLRLSARDFNDPWDSGQVGIIFCSPDKACKEFGWTRLTQKRRDKIRECLIGEIETMDQYLQGDIYGYTVKHPSGEEDSCWGFYGLETCKAEANAAAESIHHEEDRQLEFEF